MKNLSGIFIALSLLVVLFGRCSSEVENIEVITSDTLAIIDSTEYYYPSCIRDSTKAGVFGCYNMFFGRMLGDDFRNAVEAIAVQVDPQMVTVTNFCQTFELPMDGISVQYLISREHPDSVYFHFCNDIIIENEGNPYTFELKSGFITVASSKDIIDPEDDFFRLSAELINPTFTLFNDQDTTLGNILFNEVLQHEP